MSWIAVGVGAATLVGSVITADAMNDTADKSEAVAYETLNKQLAEREKVRGMSLQYAQISPAEMEAFASMWRTRTAALAKNDQLIASQQKVLDSMDPVIAESGKQLLQTLEGKSAAILAPMQRQRDLQRAKLEANMARTMGPGWRTTSAGIEALTKFDTQTIDMTSQLQFNALTQIGTAFTGSVAARNNTISTIQDLFKTNIGVDQAVMTNQDVASKRIIGAIQGSTQATPVDYGGVLEASKMQNQGTIGIGGALMNVGSNLLGQQLQANNMSDILGRMNSGGGGGGGSIVGGNLSMGQIQAPEFGQSMADFL